MHSVGSAFILSPKGATAACGGVALGEGKRRHQDSEKSSHSRIARVVVKCLREWKGVQHEVRRRHGYQPVGITDAFGTRTDTVTNPNNVIREFNKVLGRSGLQAERTPREFRHTFVSIMSAAGATEGVIADLVGHADTATTRRVYRHELRPVITEGADIMSKFLSAKGVFDDV